jgi:hypothetical protein
MSRALRPSKSSTIPPALGSPTAFHRLPDFSRLSCLFPHALSQSKKRAFSSVYFHAITNAVFNNSFARNLLQIPGGMNSQTAIPALAFCARSQELQELSLSFSYPCALSSKQYSPNSSRINGFRTLSKDARVYGFPIQSLIDPCISDPPSRLSPTLDQWGRLPLALYLRQSPITSQ